MDIKLYINGHGYYKIWYKNDSFHRDNDQPAVIYPDGNKYWYKGGLRHRDNKLPAAMFSSGYKAWYEKGTLISSSTSC
jgi:hypothetical protein